MVCSFSVASVVEDPAVSSLPWRARSRVFCARLAVVEAITALAASTLAACRTVWAFSTWIWLLAAATPACAWAAAAM